MSIMEGRFKDAVIQKANDLLEKHIKKDQVRKVPCSHYVPRYNKADRREFEKVTVIRVLFSDPRQLTFCPVCLQSLRLGFLASLLLLLRGYRVNIFEAAETLLQKKSHEYPESFLRNREEAAKTLEAQEALDLSYIDQLRSEL